jgi:alkylated DNA repair dioxygenase AlkB
MTCDLFAAGSGLVALPLPDGELLYAESVPLPDEPGALLRQLIDETPWRQETITLWGQSHLQPRLSAWYGDPQAIYTYSGMTLTPLPWTPLLSATRASVEGLAGHRFNSVLLNYYRDQNDSMGYHSDDEPELGDQPVIASLSLGAERPFLLKPKAGGAARAVKLVLKSGSLLVMQGNTQRNWKHGIAKERHPCGPRINLTFRAIVGQRP